MAQQIATFVLRKLEPYLNPGDARTLAGQWLPNLTIARGTVVGQVTATGKYGPYATGNTDGTQNPVGVTVYDFTTDANGNVVLGAAGSVADLYHTSALTEMIYWRGSFLVSDLTGLDAGAETALMARSFGTGAARWIHIP